MTRQEASGSEKPSMRRQRGAVEERGIGPILMRKRVDEEKG